MTSHHNNIKFIFINGSHVQLLKPMSSFMLYEGICHGFRGSLPIFKFKNASFPSIKLKINGRVGASLLESEFD